MTDTNFANSHEMTQQHGSTVTQFVTIRVIVVVTALVIPLFIAAIQVEAQTQAAMNAQARAAVIKTNLDHAYLLDNQFDKTKAAYPQNKDVKLGDNERILSQAVLDDLKELEEAGVTHPDMEKVKELLAAESEAR